MSDKSKIEWTDATWNPVTGCTKVSEGCRNCYAMTIAERFRGQKSFPNGFDVTLRSNSLLDPIKWRKSKKVFVNSMSDIFHVDVPEWYIDQIFGVMLANHTLDRQASHTFQLLTKRPERMREYLSVGRDALLKRWSESLDGVVIMDDPDVLFSEYISGFLDHDDFFPLPNLWLGVSVENQQAADERIPLLLQTPAAVRFLSCEPLLGPVDLRKGLPVIVGHEQYHWEHGSIDWVIVGGESGRNARPMHPEWPRSLRDQCQAAAVPYFFKQWGQWIPVSMPHENNDYRNLRANEQWLNLDGGQGFHGEKVYRMRRVNKDTVGRLLDGREWNEFPEGMNPI